MQFHSTAINPIGSKWIAYCSCGWVGIPFNLRRQAVENGTEHEERMRN